MTTTEREARLRRGIDVARMCRQIAVGLQWVAAVVAVAGSVAGVLRYESGGSARWNWAYMLQSIAGSLGWAGLVLIGSAALRLWAARLELDVASRYDTED